VHEEAGVFAGGQSDGAFGVGGVFAGGDSPLVFCELGVMVRVNDCEAALGEGDASEGVAVTEAAVEEDDANDELVKDKRDF